MLRSRHLPVTAAEAPPPPGPRPGHPAPRRAPGPPGRATGPTRALLQRSRHGTAPPPSPAEPPAPTNAGVADERATAASVRRATQLSPEELSASAAGLRSADLEVDSLCDYCRYPCHEGRVSDCDEASMWLVLWKAQEAEKPPGFDARHAMALRHGAEIAVVSAGGRCNANWKADNQDAFLLSSVPGREGAALLGVFDGHGQLGRPVAQAVRDALGAALHEELPAAGGGAPPPSGDEPEAHAPHAAALERCFHRAAAELRAAGHDLTRSGTTAVVCLVEPGSITAAWAGDSRAVLGLCCGGAEGAGPALRQPAPSGRAASEAPPLCSADLPPMRVVPLTQDHKPHHPRERERITAAGGRVARMARDRDGNLVGPFRVFLPGTWVPGLALSRSFGDSMVSGIGVTHAPELARVPLPPPSSLHASPSGHSMASNLAGATAMSAASGGGEAAPAATARRHVLVVATDGLWEWVDSEDAVRLASAMPTAEDAAAALVEAAQRAWAVRYRGRNCDDITVSVAFIPA